ncbi:hypothetical protein G7B40_017635 [Aetokthonos hydrillicola Thurmond2011]|uniref:Uncharacterized protein n=1 Tax=Aetokthonos hydrillicola Thurmond2011 TaxID=2712845 RepID=A0AAP5I7P3_9CYAN|nr:hypothetical protein [Aetokthonos hydrillicola]MBO3458185.1 hypothetical protein [Aetokthonos hydrillicola CCALA 1050]MBW4584405.1 hypothetical protein [Aetokthonos hydrillicola CCALA 1050]MDR9896366.1 hypothetical protein [Aetokthonos hydrillicola Thurmond2011]
MKKIISASLVTLAAATGFLLNNQSAQAHYPYYNRYPYHHIYPGPYCYPYTQWLVREDPADHPQAYSDGYRQGRESSRKNEKYKPRTAGGEFARGFRDGYYGRSFTGQRVIVADRYQPYVTSNCGWF